MKPPECPASHLLSALIQWHPVKSFDDIKWLGEMQQTNRRHRNLQLMGQAHAEKFVGRAVREVRAGILWFDDMGRWRRTFGQKHRAAGVDAQPKFFLGTDSAPHASHLKEHASGCAGCYTAHAAMELYAEAFDQAGALDKLEAFASFNGPDFYKLPRNADSITLVKQDWDVPAGIDYLPDDPLVPLRAGETIGWKLA
mgnify:CR=1 FL=1